MQSKTVFKKLAVFMLVLSLVLSVAGTALASGGSQQNKKVKVVFDGNGGILTVGNLELKPYERNNKWYVSFTLPGTDAGTWAGHALYGWEIGGNFFEPRKQVEIRVTYNDKDRKWNDVVVWAKWLKKVDIYILHYDITSDVPGQPADPGDETGSEPIVPSASVSLDQYNFFGWNAPEYRIVVGPTIEWIDGKKVVKTVYEGTATGFFSAMEVADRDVYSLLYKGYAEGCIFWPGDVIASETPPTLAGAPYLSGYVFSGWKPGTLDWSKAALSYSYDTVTPEEGDPYILRTVVHTIRVEGSFTLEPVPVQPQQPPVGAPQTGAAEWAGVAGAAALLSSFGLAFIARRRKDD